MFPDPRHEDANNKEAAGRERLTPKLPDKLKPLTIPREWDGPLNVDQTITVRLNDLIQAHNELVEFVEFGMRFIEQLDRDDPTLSDLLRAQARTLHTGDYQEIPFDELSGKDREVAEKLLEATPSTQDSDGSTASELRNNEDVKGGK